MEDFLILRQYLGSLLHLLIFNLFDYDFCEGSSLTYEYIDFIKSIFNIYGKNIDQKFLDTCARYGRNSSLNLCEDYALHIYERFYF